MTHVKKNKINCFKYLYKDSNAEAARASYAQLAG